MSEERWQEYLKTVYSDQLTEIDMEKMFLANVTEVTRRHEAE